MGKTSTEYDLEDHILKEPDDYQLIINDESAIVKCSCKQKINLPLPTERKHYQLSNYYKHLTRNDQCTVIKTKCLALEEEEEEEDEDDDLESRNAIPSSSLSHRLASAPTRNHHQSSKRSADGPSSSFPEAKRFRRKW